MYRNSSLHFYNEPEFGKLLYSLMQTSLFNYRDLLRGAGLGDVSGEATWQILPLGFEAPFDAVTFLAGKSKAAKRSVAVDEYIARIKDSLRMLEGANVDTGRFLTEYQVRLASTKKIAQADVTVGVKAAGENPDDAIVIPRSVDPNDSHPYLQKDILRALDSSIPGFNSRSFQAVVWKYALRNDKRFVWKSKKYEGYCQWSGETLSFIRGLKPHDIEVARQEYSAYQRLRKGTGLTTAH